MTTFSTRGQDGPASRLLIHADDPGQANRLALLGQSPVLIIMGEVVRLRAELQGLLTEALERVA